MSRALRIANLAANEKKAILHSVFPSLVEILLARDPKDHGTSKKSWSNAIEAVAIYLFICKAFNMENEELEAIKEHLARPEDEQARPRTVLSFPKLMHKLYERMSESFLTAMDCPRKKNKPSVKPNAHCLFHLYYYRMRTGVPLYVTSAEAFESSYAPQQRAFWKGTKNVPKQILENTYSRLLTLKYFGARPRFRFRADDGKSKSNTCDFLAVHKDGHIYKLTSYDQRARTFKARRVRVKKWRPGLDNPLNQLPWELVGVHVFDHVEDDEVVVRKDDLTRKAMHCGNFLIEWKPEWLGSRADT